MNNENKMNVQQAVPFWTHMQFENFDVYSNEFHTNCKLFSIRNKAAIKHLITYYHWLLMANHLIYWVIIMSIS